MRASRPAAWRGRPPAPPGPGRKLRAGPAPSGVHGSALLPVRPPPSAPRRRAQGALSSRDASCLSPLGRGHPAVSFTARFAHFAWSPVRPLWTAAFRGPRLTVPGDTALTNCSQGRVSPCPSGAHRERTPDRARSAPSDAGGSLSGRPAPAARSPVVRAPALCLLT